MDFFAIVEHFDKLGDFLRTRPGLLDVLNSEQDGIPILAIERRKKRFGFWVCIKGFLQIVRDGRSAR